MWNPFPLEEPHPSLQPNPGITLFEGSVDMPYLKHPIPLLTDQHPSSVVLSPHHTEFVLKRVVCGEAEILISLVAFW